MTGSLNLTERQAKYFASMRASLEKITGKSLAEWVDIAKTCPESTHRARLAWFKRTHGVMQNRASQVLSEAFGSSAAWRDPEALIEGLWTDADAREIYEAIDGAALALPGVLRTARKGYTAWSRAFQFAAARPVRGGVVLGLAIATDPAAELEPPRSEPWSERLKSRLALGAADDVDDRLRAWLETAWHGAS
jgi:hypothetical protein